MTFEESWELIERVNLGNYLQQSIPSGGKNSTKSPYGNMLAEFKQNQEGQCAWGSEQGEVRGGHQGLIGLWVLL